MRDRLAGVVGTWFAVVSLCVALPVAHGAPSGKVGGRILGTDTGEPIGFADIALVPVDSTLRTVGGLTNADGTFLLEAAPGAYRLRVRALSYRTRIVDGVVVEAGALRTLDTALAPEALEQEEVVVEAERSENTDVSMLAARRKAAAVGDAISAEQVRRSVDKDAAEVLKRVTGLSVSDGKYVFVRGLGERYSSTEVDGVRLATPEQNKRVVPLDLVPSSLLENIIVQKTYTADRPGEFGGGDVQVRTKDFPGQRTWQVSVSQGVAEGVERKVYGGFDGDAWGFGAGARAMPDGVRNVQLPLRDGSTLPQLAAMARSFSNTWSFHDYDLPPNGSYAATVGDEFELFGRPFGVVQSWSFARSFDRQQESQRFFQSLTDTLYDYDVTRWTETAQLGGLAGLSYRLSPGHSLHLRGLYSHSGEDEVRSYEGVDHNNTEAFSEQWQHRRNTRLTYVERDVLSGSVEGSHAFQRLLGARFDWKFTRSRATRVQPERRDVTYNRRFYFDGDTAHWVLGSRGGIEYGDLADDGYGTTLQGAVPFRLGRLGQGKATIGVDRQTKERDNFYRRFHLVVDPRYVNVEAPPESIFAPGHFGGGAGSGYLEDVTFNEPLVGVDNYRAGQRVSAAFLNVDVPLGPRVRGNVGVRVEHGVQTVESFALFDPSTVLVEGALDDTDWLPAATVTWAVTPAVQLRAAASRTISRPDLNELSPSPFPEYIGGFYVKGNPELERARLDNYDLRLEAFPTLSEVLAIGLFHKTLHDPIETVIRGGTPALLVPENSASGRNRGLELEARIGLGRLWRPLAPLTLNSNASFIASQVTLRPRVSRTGTTRHPLQGQASYLVNVGLGWAVPGRVDAAVLYNALGERLRTLGYDPLPDIYEQPSASLDATLNLNVFRGTRLKMSAKNLLDPRIERLQGGREVSAFRSGRSVSVSVSVGS